MKRLILSTLFAALAVVAVFAQERATLSTPQTVSVTHYDIARIDIQRLPSWGLRIYYVGSDGKEHLDEHGGSSAQALVTALNKANLSTSSLEKRAILHLQDAAAHGGVAKIPAGSVTGSPQ